MPNLDPAFTIVASVDSSSGAVTEEALYYQGRLLKTTDGGGRLTAYDVLEAVGSVDHTVTHKFVELTPEFDEEVVAMEGWPETLEEIPADARR